MSPPSKSHPLYPLHHAAIIIQRAYRAWKFRVRRFRHHAMYQLIQQEMAVRRQLIQLDTKMSNKLARLQAKAKYKGKLNLPLVDMERNAVIRIQRWWRQCYSSRISSLPPNNNKCFSITTSLPVLNQHEDVIVNKDELLQPWSYLTQLGYTTFPLPLIYQSQYQLSNERSSLPPSVLNRIRELRRMYLTQIRIDERNNNNNSKVINKTLLLLHDTIIPKLLLQWNNQRENEINLVNKISNSFYDTAQRITISKQLITNIKNYNNDMNI